jgi:soluble lytic murein transglycosylase-like protein
VDLGTAGRLTPQRSHRGRRRRAVVGIVLAALALLSARAQAGAQQYEPLSAAVQAQMQRSVADDAPVRSAFASPDDEARWFDAMLPRLARRVPDDAERRDLLRAVHYEATRAGLDPQMVLGLIEVESAFRKYAVSGAGARGYMQVMPFWVALIGTPDHNLFHLRTSLRYGCTILRHYLDRERGDVYRALARYNGSLLKPQGYPEAVLRAWQTRWLPDVPPLEPARRVTRTADRSAGRAGAPRTADTPRPRGSRDPVDTGAVPARPAVFMGEPGPVAPSPARRARDASRAAPR